MYQALYKYFALYHHLYLPGIGNIIISEKESNLDFTNRLITPVDQHLSLVHDDKNDDALVLFLSAELNINKEQALDKLNHFSNNLREQLISKGSAVMPGIGTISSVNDVLSLSATESTAHLFQPLTAKKIIRQNNEHLVRVGENYVSSASIKNNKPAYGDVTKDNWWIAAVVILILAVGGSLLFLLRSKLYWF